MRPQIFVSRTLEKLGRTCDQIGRTLEPCSNLCCDPWLLVCTCGDVLGDCHIINAVFDVSSHSFSLLLQVCVIVVGDHLFKHVPVCVLEAVLQC